ncbi:unnamed protein product [Prorocentrum cordatum]|uniref:Uncharacterized protein n=1 Tax=Prorocentrum cordatum TaxID=2364126 RepID=A0ABN9PAX7_9DINO|nr:unnamed protein product [Polarella glacialis]
MISVYMFVFTLGDPEMKRVALMMGMAATPLAEAHNTCTKELATQMGAVHYHARMVSRAFLTEYLQDVVQLLGDTRKLELLGISMCLSPAGLAPMSIKQEQLLCDTMIGLIRGVFTLEWVHMQSYAQRPPLLFCWLVQLRWYGKEACLTHFYDIFAALEEAELYAAGLEPTAPKSSRASS